MCTAIRILQDRGVYPPCRSSELGPNPDTLWESVLGGTSCHSGLPTSGWDPAGPQGTCTSLNNVGKGNQTQRLSGVFWSFLAVGAEGGSGGPQPGCREGGWVRRAHCETMVLIMRPATYNGCVMLSSLSPITLNFLGRFFFFDSFIGISFTYHTIQPSIGYSSMASSIFPGLLHYHYNQPENTFLTPKRKPWSSPSNAPSPQS